MENTGLSRRGFLKLGLAGLLAGTGCATIATTGKPEQIVDARYGAWESQNIEGYNPVGNQEGYFHAKAGEKDIKPGHINLKYVALDKLAELSKDREVEVCITEPEWCATCFYDALELQENGKDKGIIYLTVKQAQKIGWQGEYIPKNAKVIDGRIE